MNMPPLVNSAPESPARIALGSRAVDAETQKWTAQAGVLVIGTGCAGLAAALSAHHAGSDVLVLEKDDMIGGTTKKAGVWIWIPNNSLLRAAGLSDPKEDSLRYMCRLARPQLYDPDHATFGIPADEYSLIETFYDEASDAIDALTAWGALDPIHRPDAPDYYAALPENKSPYGHVMYPQTPDGGFGTGVELVRQLSAAVSDAGIRIATGKRVVGALTDAGGTDVIGVEVRAADGGTELYRATRGVVFATGGFTHNPDMLLNFSAGPLFGGAAALSNEGDFIPIATSLGATLGNMNFAWFGPIALEQRLRSSDTVKNIYSVGGDSMIFVNKYGRRVVNEKAPYNELTYSFFHWDPSRAEYPNLLQFMVYDAESARQFADVGSGNPIPSVDEDDSHVIVGETLDDLVEGIRARLTDLARLSGGVELAPGFVDELRAAISRFNAFAADGVDADFHRGESPIELFRNGPARSGNDRNPTMFPISDTGPYYAVILAPATLDTRGGPKVDARTRVLDSAREPIGGLFAAGNCIASPSGQGYWGGGATVGLGLTFGVIAGAAAARRVPSAV